MIRKLLEAVNINDALFIGSGKGYDVFDVRTYAAAQEFVTESGNPAGAAYTQNEQTFNGNVNDTLHLYFFTVADRNEVVGAVIKSDSINSTLRFKSRLATTIDVNCNFQYESVDRDANVIDADFKLPLYLLPGASFNGNTNIQNGLIINNNQLVAALPQITEITNIDNLVIPESVNSIAENAFNYGLDINSIEIDAETVSSIDDYAMNGVQGSIKVRNTFEKPDGWRNNWNANCLDRTIYGYEASEEELAEREAELARQEAERLERERLEQERLQREREEAERIERERAEREARKLRYKEEGKNITIKGTIPGISELDIPEEINGKPVTKIESYAFYDNEDLVSVTLPKTLKLIEQGAFMNCINIQHKIAVPADCIVGPNAFRNTHYGFKKTEMI